MPKPTEIQTNLKQRRIYAELIGFFNGGHQKTMREVSDTASIPYATVHDNVEYLKKCKFVRSSPRGRIILFHRGVNYRIIEEYIRIDRKNKMIKIPNNLVVAGSGYTPMVRTHLNGGWITFYPEKEGAIEGFDEPIIRTSGKIEMTRVHQALFGKKDPVSMKGQKKWSGMYFYNGQWFNLRYMKPLRTNNMSFGVSATEILQTPNEIDEKGSDMNIFLRTISPMLEHLEKYAEWKFKKDEYGVYIFKASSRIEYGLDSLISDTITDVAGEIGVPGVTNLWKDHSEGSMSSDGEYETNQAVYVKALYDLPQTTMDIKQLSERVESLEKRLNSYSERSNVRNESIEGQGDDQ